jgi:hypothetical protein
MLKESILKNFNLDVNFWQLNPQLVLAFNNLYNSDNSKNKEKSSKIMWAIAMLYDPSENNQFRNAEFDKKKELIRSVYINDKNFAWENYLVEIETYKDYALSPIEREILVLEESLASRREFLRTPYTPKTAALLDDMHKKSVDIQKQHIELRKLIKETNIEGKTKGNRQKSFIETIRG